MKAKKKKMDSENKLLTRHTLSKLATIIHLFHSAEHFSLRSSYMYNTSLLQSSIYPSIHEGSSSAPHFPFDHSFWRKTECVWSIVCTVCISIYMSIRVSLYAYQPTQPTYTIYLQRNYTYVAEICAEEESCWTPPLPLRRPLCSRYIFPGTLTHISCYSKATKRPRSIYTTLIPHQKAAPESHGW